jgi:histidine triad (HIT) family protein
MSACVFCRIVDGDIPAKVVHQDAQVLVFEDVNAQAPVHLLVIPKRHVGSVQDCEGEDAALLGHLLLTCSKVARIKNLAQSGYRIVTNTGVDAGQSVAHLHFHVVGGRSMGWPPG